MRVVAGTHKGRRLKNPPGLECRPTSTRVREALFSILAHRTQGAHVLDLYAGTGALGIESLSRGAKHVAFVENRVSTIELLRENIRRCGYDRYCVVYAQDVETFLALPPSFGGPPVFDIVFADPPYQTTDLAHLLERLSLSEKVVSRGVVILEHFFKHTVPSQVGSLTQTRQSQYGDTMLTFFQPANSSEDACD